MAAHPLSTEELDALIGDRPVTEFLHPGSDLYRERKMAEHPPSREEAIRLMAQDPNLILRPVIRAGDRVVARPDDETLAELATCGAAAPASADQPAGLAPVGQALRKDRSHEDSGVHR